MAGNSRVLTVRIVSDASRVGVGLGEAQAKYGKFAQALGTKSGSAGIATGNALVSGIDKALGVGLKVAGLAGGAVLGTALFSGFNRLNAIDQATAKLTGLGHSAGTVQKIMDNALASVKGTAFGLGSAAGVAAQLVAAQIKPGKQLESTLKLVADSATIAGTSMEDMGSIWAKVAAKNKLQGDVINQLTTAGIPILQLLAKHYGITAEAASTMVSKGEVDFAGFAAAMKAGMGGAALESGNTFQGAWQNTLAAIGRIGANLLSPLFTGAKDGLKGLPELLAPIEDWAKSAGQAIADMGKWVQQNAGLLKGLGIAAGVAIAVLLGFRTVIAVMSAYRAVLAVVKAFQIGYAAATYGTAAASYAGAAGTLAQNVALVAGKAVFLAVAAAQHIAAAAQWAFNAAMSANPIMLIIIVIVALVAAFILLWTKCEGFRNFWIGLWAGIVAVVKVVVDWIVAAWQSVVSWLTSAWEGYLAFGRAIWAGWQAAVAAVASWFQNAWSAAISVVSAIVAGIAGFFSSAFSVVRSVVQSVASFFSSSWQSAVSLVSGIIRTMQGVFQSVFSAIMAPINAVIGAFQTVVGWIKQVINWLSQIKIPDVFGAIGGLFGARSLEVAGTYSMQPVSPLAARSGTLAGLPALRALPSLRTAAAGGQMGDIISISVEGGLDSADTIARRVKQVLENRDRRSRGVSVAMRTA